MAKGLQAERVSPTSNSKPPSSPNSGSRRAAKSRDSKPKVKHPKFILLLLFVSLLLLPFLIVHYITSSEEAKIYTSAQTVPDAPTAVIFGAGVNKDSTPSWMLADRLDGGIKLYQMGKVESLLMTGGEVEVIIMRRYAEQHGVPASAIEVDSAGLRTYDSCYRAARDLKITDAILVTQEYHLPRTLYLCNSLGVNAVGFKVGGDSYGQDGWNHFREFFAQVDSWVDVNISQPTPKADATTVKR